MLIEVPSYLAMLSDSTNHFDPDSVTVTLGGRRVVMINGKEMDLKALANQLISISSSSSVVDQLSAKSRINGIRVVEKIEKAYRTADQKIQKENIFTRALLWMRESFGSLLMDTRRLIETEVKRGFTSYGPKAAILREFGPVENETCNFYGRMYFREDFLQVMAQRYD